MKKNYFLLIPIFVLCTSCTNESLFFTDSSATIEEVNAFIDKVGRDDNLIPEGWYKYKQYTNNDLIFDCTFKCHYLPEKDSAVITHLNGTYKVYYTEANKIEIKIYYDENYTFIYYLSYDGRKTTYGGVNITFDFGRHLFDGSGLFYKNAQEYYLKSNSICTITKTSSYYLPDYYFGAVYNSDLTKLKKAELKELYYDDINLNLYTSYNYHLKTCEETYTYSHINKNYEVSIDNGFVYIEYGLYIYES